jgi:chlorite dismutase
MSESSIDLREHGAGQAVSERRLFMQLLVFHESVDSAFAIESLQQMGIPGVLYEDLHNPRGIGLLTWHEDPAFFVTELRRLLVGEPFIRFDQRHELSMFGRTYAIGYESDLDDVLIHRPLRHVLDEQAPWAVWYPLRRSGAFSQLPPDQRKRILAEHGRIGHAFGEAGLAADVRLACHGLDVNDSDFVIGLIGGELAALSKCVQAMRPTEQTSQYTDRLGPFFVGHKVWQSGTQTVDR